VLQRRWTLDPTLVRLLQELDRWAAGRFAELGLRWFGISIISGYRSKARQARENPDAPDSLHTTCPALAVDLRMGNLRGVEADTVWEWLGAQWQVLGGRWGGGFTGGLPGVNRREQNHFDLFGFTQLPGVGASRTS